MTLLVSDEDVRASLSMRDCIAAVERAFVAAGRGQLDLLERRVVSAQGGARIHSLAAASQELGYLFSLVYSGTPEGQDKNATPVSRRQKIFTLFDARTGACEAVWAGATCRGSTPGPSAPTTPTGASWTRRPSPGPRCSSTPRPRRARRRASC